MVSRDTPDAPALEPSVQNALKAAVRQYWEDAPCGEVYATGDSEFARLERQRAFRYALEPYIADFARFADGTGRDVLEIGVGMGADHLEWAKASPRSLAGVDLTEKAVELTRARLSYARLSSDLHVADAERLPFADERFDLVYSWGVLHHSPDTARAVRELIRVLRPGGTARVMIYHRYSVVGYLLWLRYALLAGHPGLTLSDVYATRLESPGTRAFSIDEARAMFAGCSRVDVRTQLSFGDLLEGAAGERHGSAMLQIARALWPRWLIRRAFARQGLLLLVEAVK